MLCQSPFTPLDSLQDCNKLYQFLDFCKQQSIAEQHEKIASISSTIESIDPLAVLWQFGKPQQRHFYFENRDQERAIAAIGEARSIQIEGTRRFETAQEFIQRCLKHFVISDASNLPWAQPCFFSSFTFFDQSTASNSYFPSAIVFLPQWQIVQGSDRSAILLHQVIEADTNIELLTEKIWRDFQSIQQISYSFFHFSTQLPTLLNWEIVDTHDFQSTVVAALKSIQQQQLNKLVLAHAIDVVSPLPFQWGHSLHNLRQLHPDCYVFSVGNGHGQSFVGASPERLLSVCDRTLITDALAGSAPRGRTLAEDTELAQRLLNNDKERREHQVVVDFIHQTLAQFGLKLRFTHVPDLLQLSNIQHLHTPIQTVLPVGLHPLEILAALHPTPAVAGLPREIACEQIQQYEQFERSLYAAPIGWVDAQNNAEFVVGIRSALLDGNRARLYAGAGIVSGSDPEREFAEVRLKLQALLRALV
ncbi:isochorismate synthase [Thermocoleostomius sinensis]|uniref:isochorismate synthase n=1 Tax=Thermocoleostomius sinensis A174 TaxID=2016057 RepID=A0A9E9CCF0_9CYAN|nr:isochorismate synthase [Thermocoleostomius sinensis]WAL62750.1 isochorismate synthase [Thermocoleostomius sinensis A174]